MVSSSVLISVLSPSDMVSEAAVPAAVPVSLSVPVVVPGISASGLQEAANNSRQASPADRPRRIQCLIFIGINFLSP